MPGLYGAGIWTQDFREKPYVKNNKMPQQASLLMVSTVKVFSPTSILAITHRYPDSLHNEMKQRREGRGVKRKQQATVATGISPAGIKTQTH